MLWVYNKNYWTKNGVYVVQDLEAKGLSEKFNVNDFEERLEGGTEINGVVFSKDRKVRFAPKGSYDFGEQSLDELSRNKFVLQVMNKKELRN